MKIIVVNSSKGGVGRSTICAHLAVAASTSSQGPVVLIDTDQKQCLAKWWEVREDIAISLIEISWPIFARQIADLKAIRPGVVLIDTPRDMTDEIRGIVQLADLVVIPTMPSPNDLWAIGHTVEFVEQAGLPFVFVLNGAKPNGMSAAQAAAVLSQRGKVAPILGHRTAYAAALTDGRTVQEIDPHGPGAAEMASLWHFISDQLTLPVVKQPR